MSTESTGEVEVKGSKTVSPPEGRVDEVSPLAGFGEMWK